MNILGHAYVATEAIKGNRQLLIIGSLLPESSPFIPNNPFTWDEIHEGGEVFLQFLKENFPEKQDLALGMIAHSAKFGADGWNKRIEQFAEGKKECLSQKIAQASGWSSLEYAEFWFHNYLWWGMEVWILKNNPEFVKEVKGVLKGVDISEVSRLLAECFDKDFKKVEKTFQKLFKEIYRSEDLNSVAGLAQIWARQAAGLTEKIKVNPQKAAGLFEEIYLMFENQWQGIMGKVVSDVRKNLENLLAFSR